MVNNPFDLTDADYLRERFTQSQLRAEIHWAQPLAAVAETFRGTEYETPEDSFPYRDYIAACEQAIKDHKDIASRRPRQAPVTGRVSIPDIKARNDIVTVMEWYTSLRKSGGRFIGRCPLHEDNHPSLVVYPSNQSWHCFQCNQGGDIFDFIQAVEHTDFKGAAAILGSR